MSYYAYNERGRRSRGRNKTQSLRYPVDYTGLDTKITFGLAKFGNTDVQFKLNANNTYDEFFGGGQDMALKRAARQQRQESMSNSSRGAPRFTGDMVSLYLPLSFAVQDQINYNTAELGVAGLGAAKAVAAGRGIQGTLVKAVEEGGKSLVDFFSGVAGKDIGRAATARAFAAMPLVPDNVKAGVSIAAGVAVNPNLRTQFTGVGIRQFTFTFKFIPTSAQESLEVKKIIQFFRENAYPEEIELTAGLPVAYEYPNLFKIRLLSGVSGEFENVGSPIKLCYLTNISHTYNATSSVVHPDGAPTEIDLSLSFQEYKTLSRKDILNEGNDTFWDYEL